MHSAYQIANARIELRSRRDVQVRTCRCQAEYDASACWRKLFALADPTENAGPAQSIISFS
jgi:hypothetical protein